MAITITINGSVTLDESLGLQDSGIAVPPEDNDDSDVLLSALPTAFSDRLFTDLGLDSTFADANGVAESEPDYIELSGTGSVVSLGFTTTSGGALPVYGVDLVGAACNLTALDGGAITLFADSVLGSQVVYGVDTDGDIVFAMYMDPAIDLLSAKVWTVQFEALDNPDDTDHDDPLTLTGLGVGAGTTTEFNFNELPSGANLFGMLGSGSSGLIVFGTTTVLKNDHTYKNPGSDVIQTSQAGPNATIGLNSQMFDPGDSAYFTYVKTPNADFTSSNLSPNEADDADNLLYGDADAGTNDTIEASSAFLEVAQIQSGTIASMSITAYNITGSPQGTNLLDGSGQNAVAVNRVIVYAADGVTVLDDSNDPASDNPDISFSFDGGVATVTGFEADNKIEWYTSAPHDQVKIAGVTGKFDIGGFGVSEPTAVSVPLTGVRFEDDGPVLDLELDGTAELVVDETTLPVSDSILAADLYDVITESFGTDGPGTVDSVYELLLGDPNSGLYDTLTGDEVILSINGAGTLITGSVDDGVLPTPDVVFTIEIDPDTGDVTLTQYRAMINGDPNDPDEDDTPLTLADGTVSVQRTITDGDDDSASDVVDISSIFKFEDDGPALPPATQDVLELVTDDTDVTDTATLSTDLIFTGAIDYGNDGPNQTDPIVYELRLAGLDPDPDSGLVDTATGKAILLKKVGADIIGYVDTNGDGTLQAGETTAAIKYSLSGNDPLDTDTETVTFTQYRAVVHDDIYDPNEALSPETINGGLVFIDQKAIDGDGDVSNTVSFDLGAITQLLDDGPSIGPISDGLVDFALNDFVTNDLNGDVGNDPNGAPYIITAFTLNTTAGLIPLQGVLAGDAKSVTYYADTDGSGTFGDGTDVAYYKLELGDQGGEGDYTFTVLVNPPPAFTEFNFDTLPSGSNLFGIVGDADAGLIIFGRDIGLNAADNTYIANQTQEIKTSQAGIHDTIGIGSQMFDPGDAAYFTFVNNPDPNFTGSALGSTEADDADNILYGSTIENDSAFVRIAQLQGNTDPSMSIQLFNIDDSPQGVDMITARGINVGVTDPDVIAVRVYDALGNLLEDTDDLVNFNDPNITVSFLDGVATVTGFDENYKIEWDADEDFDQTLITGVAGKFDIGGFGFLQGNDTPDQLLEFTAQVTDGDGDFATDSWKIGIDGTGIYDDNDVDGISII